MSRIRVLVVDDHPLYRSGLRALLDTQDDIEVVAEADTGELAIAIALENQPDVIVMDLAMPGIGGLSAIETITGRQHAVRILALTMMDDAATVAAAMNGGAHGYLVKGAAGDEALRAIRAVAAGQFVLDARVAPSLLGSAPKVVGPKEIRARFPGLTAREADILQLIADGLSNAGIARRLHLSEKTVRNYSSPIFRKLGVGSRLEAARAVHELER